MVGAYLSSPTALVRIALVAPLVAPLTDATSRGSHVIISELARLLQARGHEVAVFCAAGSSLRGLEVVTVAVDPSASGAALVAGRHATAGNAALAAAFAEIYARVRRWRPDVVSQHAFDVEAFTLARGLPIVHTLHLNPVEGPLLDEVRVTGAPLVAVSHDSARRWREAGARDVTAIPNGVPDRTLTLAPPDPIALVAGRVSPEKGTAAALRVARRAGLEAVLVGEVYDRDYFAREVVPLLGGVRMLETLQRERLWELMARAAVLLMPIAWDEPFGLVAAEAQMAGCPVAAYARGALPEIVPQGGGGVLVAPGDEDALVAAIPAARAMDRARIRAGARARFDLQVMARAHEATLSAAAAAAARR